MTHNLIIKGRVPSKKNSRVNCRSGRSFPSRKYTSWHKSASDQILWKNRAISECFVRVFFWMPDNRRADLTNKAESIMDLLVDNGVIEDDNWKVVKSVCLDCMGVDKNNPRVEIEIIETKGA